MTSARSTTLRVAAGVAVAALALAGCGDTDDGATSTPTTSASVTTPDESATVPESTAPSVAPSPSVSPEPSASGSATESAPPSTRPVMARAKVVAGQVTTESDNYAIAPGDDVRVAVKSDMANELHVHGIEQELALEAGVKGVLEFTVPDDLAPGVYEVELHDPALLLFTLTVS